MSNEVLVSEQVLQVPFNYSAGPTASRFFVSLRDRQVIEGIKCEACNMVYVPPRQTCGRCFQDMSKWVETGPEGELMNFTVVHYPEPVHPVSAPFVMGLIRLEGADTSLLHLIRAPLDQIRQGMRVRPVFAKERRGHILDIECFEPAG